MGLGLCGLSSPPCPCGRIINGTRKRRARRASSSAGRADRSQAMPAERIKSWGGEGQNSDKPAEPWQFLEASGSHFAVKAGHHGGHFVRSNGRAGSHLVLAEGRKLILLEVEGGSVLGATRASLPLAPSTANKYFV